MSVLVRDSEFVAEEDDSVKVWVLRGNDSPKKALEKKLHPTFEVFIRINRSTRAGDETLSLSRSRFFDQYRKLREGLAKHHIGDKQKIPIKEPFPPTYFISSLGIKLSEEQLQQRCSMLNHWMHAVLSNLYRYPQPAQKLVADFLSMEDGDTTKEANRDLILKMIKEKYRVPTIDFEPRSSYI